MYIDNLHYVTTWGQVFLVVTLATDNSVLSLSTQLTFFVTIYFIASFETELPVIAAEFNSSAATVSYTTRIWRVPKYTGRFIFAQFLCEREEKKRWVKCVAE